MMWKDHSDDRSINAAGYDVPSNLSSSVARAAAFAAFCAAAKKDRQLMEATRLRLDQLYRGLKRFPLTPADKEDIEEMIADSVDNSQQRLSIATEAGERLMLELGCPESVVRQLRRLQRAWSELHILLQLVRSCVGETDRGRQRLRFVRKRAGSYDVRRASMATEIHMESLLRRLPTRATKLTRTPLTENNEDTAAEYLKVHDRVMRYVKPEHGLNIDIQSIEKIENSKLDERLYDAYRELHKNNCVPELLCHGTKGVIAESIIREGFMVGKSGMYGAGIYFATDSTKSAQYCKDVGVKSLLLCDVLLGKTMVRDAPKNDLTQEVVRSAGYDSVFAKRNTKGAGGVLNDEYIVYRPEQATPRYLVKFTT